MSMLLCCQSIPKLTSGCFGMLQRALQYTDICLRQIWPIGNHRCNPGQILYAQQALMETVACHSESERLVLPDGD